MLVYQLYKNLIKDGNGEMFEYLAFVWFGFLSLFVDLLLFPLEIIAFILWKLKGDK